MKANPLRWFEIYVDDMARAKTFYESVFETKLERLNNPEVELWAFPMAMNAPGISGALVKMDGFSAGKNSVIIYFGCDECSIETARVKKYGGKVQRDKFSIGEYGFISLVYDTEGNMVGLHSMK